MIGFLSNEGRSKAVVISRIILIVVLAIAIVSAFMEYSLLKQIADGMDVTDAQATASDSRQSMIGWLNIIVLIVCGVTYVLWFYRAYQNSHLINIDLKYKQWWAFGGWFIPIMSWFVPYIIMRDMYSRTANYVGVSYRKTFFQLWWAGFLITNFLSRLYLRTIRAETIEAFMMADIIDIASSVMSILTVLCSIKVVRDYHDMEKLIPNVTVKAIEQDQVLSNT